MKPPILALARTAARILEGARRPIQAARKTPATAPAFVELEITRALARQANSLALKDTSYASPLPAGSSIGLRAPPTPKKTLLGRAFTA